MTAVEEKRATSFAAPKGIPEYYPPESAGFAHVRAALETAAERAGYGLLELPVFEDTALYARGVGESTDVVSKEMYTFADRGDRSVTLRPEGTAGDEALVPVLQDRRERAADGVEGQDRQRQREAGQDRVGRRLVEVVLAGAQHLAPARRRRRDADPEEGKRGFQQDGDGGQDHHLHQDGAPGVRQHGAEHVVSGRRPKGLHRRDEVALSQGENLGARHAG